MNERKIKSRIVHKHDIEANWLKATNFIPLQGEMIIYDIEIDNNGNTLDLPEGRVTPYTYERVKIGDGKTLINMLPFIDEHKADISYVQEYVDTTLGAVATALSEI